jgi:head-tail adaptor
VAAVAADAAGVSEFAGGLTQRAVVQRRSTDRDDLGGADGPWTTLAQVWAALAPIAPAAWGEGDRPSANPRWRATLRATDVMPGDRLQWRDAGFTVRSVERDPAAPDRLTLVLEEDR